MSVVGVFIRIPTQLSSTTHSLRVPLHHFIFPTTPIQIFGLKTYDKVSRTEANINTSYQVTRSITQRHQNIRDTVHQPINRMPSSIVFPDNASITSSSSGTTMSDVTETLNSVVLNHSNEELRTIIDLPAEIVLQIYKHLDSHSGIAALNTTSRMYNWIWRTNTASISSAVLSRSIDCYNSALERFEVEERVKQVHCITLPHSAVVKCVRIALRQARDAIRQGRSNDRWDYTSRDVHYRGVLYRNRELLSAARDASYLLGLIRNRVVHSGGSLDDFDRQIAPSSQDIIVAYHELIILVRLRILKAMKARLKTTCRKKIRKMLYVATYLLCYCPDKEKLRLGISRKATLRVLPWIDDWDLTFRPRCHVIVHARRAFFAIADAVGEARIPDYILDNRSGCHGDCEDSGENGEK